jgi:hypothetical protein
VTRFPPDHPFRRNPPHPDKVALSASLLFDAGTAKPTPWVRNLWTSWPDLDGPEGADRADASRSRISNELGRGHGLWAPENYRYLVPSPRPDDERQRVHRVPVRCRKTSLVRVLLDREPSACPFPTLPVASVRVNRTVATISSRGRRSEMTNAANS